MDTTTETDRHLSVGPMDDMYGHGPVTIIQEPEVSDRSSDEGTTLFVCLDCGFTCADNRLLAHEECDREDNPINTTWREFLEERHQHGGKEALLPEASNTDDWPIE